MNDVEKKRSITRSQWSVIFLILAVSGGERDVPPHRAWEAGANCRAICGYPRGIAIHWQ